MEAKTKQAHAIEDQEVDDIVREHLAAFVRGDFDAWGNHFAPNVFFIASDPEEVFFDRAEAVAEMHKDFDPAFDEGLQVEIDVPSLHIGFTLDGNVAWSAAPLQYTISFQEEANSFVLRHTNVLSKINQRWSIVVTQYSLALPESRILEALTGGYLPAPNVIGDARQAGSQSLLEQFMLQLADLSKAVISQDAYVFGPFPEENAEGRTEVQALFAKWASRWGTLRLRPDGIRAELDSEKSGWVGANVEVTIFYAGQPMALPMRFLVVYQKEQGTWSIAHAHLSLGIPDELAE